MRKLSEITDAVLTYHPTADLDVIFNAYMFSAKAHRGQSRDSGEAYLSHPVEVAFNLTRLKMDERTIAAGLLHDTIEDTLTTSDEIQNVFGEEVYHLVEGVTKIGQMPFASKEEKQAENYRKMVLAMAQDIRVVMIKLADRAHNLKTLDSLPEEKQKRIARETLDIYAPMANRLGIGWLKTELEDGSFKYLHPGPYRTLLKKVEQVESERGLYVEECCRALDRELKSSGIAGKVMGRPKHFYSIYQKMIVQDLPFDELYDLVGLRVIVESEQSCYAVLGVVHSLWRPIPGKFKDYIAMPKPNRYQSLHTTVSGPRGQRVEVQIRTAEMHRVAEQGIAAHWQYKEDGNSSVKHLNDHLDWVRTMMEEQKEIKNAKDFLASFKVDLYFQEVFVFTPQGEVVAMPRGATPIDLAYNIHTDIGHHCIAAKVNGKLVSLRYKLKNGDQVEVVTDDQKFPSREWLPLVKTSKARNKISNYLNHRERERSRILGTELLENMIRKTGLEPQEVLQGPALDEAIHSCGFNNYDNLLMSVGYGKTSARRVLEKLVPREKIPAARHDELTEKTSPGSPGSPIRVKDFEDELLIRMGKCCNPIPGDSITGYITRGRGISVHHSQCPSVTGLVNESERLLEVEWDPPSEASFPTRVSIVTVEKQGQLAKISQGLAECEVNITRANVRLSGFKRAYFDLTIEIHDLSHLEKTFQRLKQIDGVLHVERVQEFGKKKPSLKGDAWEGTGGPEPSEEEPERVSS